MKHCGGGIQGLEAMQCARGMLHGRALVGGLCCALGCPRLYRHTRGGNFPPNFETREPGSPRRVQAMCRGMHLGRHAGAGAQGGSRWM